MVTPKWGPPPLLMASTLLSLGGHEDISQCFFLRKTIIPEMLPDSKEDPLPSHHLQACQRATFNSASSVPWLTTLQLSPHSPFCTQCSVPVLGTGSPSHRYCIITARDSSIIPTVGSVFRVPQRPSSHVYSNDGSSWSSTGRSLISALVSLVWKCSFPLPHLSASFLSLTLTC
jgi:hypothetical protein